MIISHNTFLFEQKTNTPDTYCLLVLGPVPPAKPAVPNINGPGPYAGKDDKNIIILF
jgi:hypothetical protein